VKPSLPALSTGQSSENRLSISTETITCFPLNRLLEWLSKIFSSNAIGLKHKFDESAPFLANTKDRNNLAYIPRATFLLLSDPYSTR